MLTTVNQSPYLFLPTGLAERCTNRFVLWKRKLRRDIDAVHRGHAGTALREAVPGAAMAGLGNRYEPPFQLVSRPPPALPPRSPPAQPKHSIQSKVRIVRLASPACVQR